MINWVLYGISLVCFGFGVAAFIRAAQLRREIRRREEDLKWQRSILDRALAQITSGAEEDAIAGIQALTVLGRVEHLAPLEVARGMWRENSRVLSHVDEGVSRLAEDICHAGQARKRAEVGRK